jgi:hypothetical protein
LDGDGFIEYWKDIQYAPYTYPSGGATKSGVIIKWRAINNDDLSVKYKIERAQIDPLNLYLDDQRPWETKNIIPEIYGLSRDNIKTLKADWKEIGTVDLTKVGNSERETIYAGGYYAPNSAYPNPVWVPGTIAEDHFVGFYIDKDVSLQTREYYAYRITAIKDGVEAEPVIKIVDKAPFVKYSNLQLYAMGNVPNLSSRTLDNSNSPNAVDPRPNLRSDFFDPLKDSVYTPGISPEKRPSYYKTNSIVLFLTAPQSEYIDDVDVEIWRRIVTGNPETPFDKLVTTVSGKLIREGNTVESGPDSNLTDYANIPNWYEYEDTDGLVVGVIYQYKAVIPLDGQARTGNAYPNKARTNITKVWTDTPRRNPDPTYVPESAIIGQEYIADALDPVIGTAVWPQIAGAGNSGLFRWNDLEITVADPTSLPTATTTRSINIKFKGNQASQQVYYEIRDNNQYIDQGVTEGGFPTGSTPGRYFSLGRLSVQRTAVVQPSLGNITKYVRLIKDNADIVLPNPTYRKTSATSSPANYPQVTGIIGGTLDPSGTTKLATNGDVIRDTVAGNYNVWLIMGYLADPTNAPNAVTQMLPGTGNTSLGPNANNKDSSNGWKIDPAGGPGYTVNALLPERTPALR